jgi:hypothetical protein
MPANAGETIRAKPLRPVPMTNLGYRVTSGEVRRSSRTNVKVETVIPADIFSEFDFFSQYGPTFNYTFSNLPAGVTIKNVINAEV